MALAPIPRTTLLLARDDLERDLAVSIAAHLQRTRAGGRLSVAELQAEAADRAEAAAKKLRLGRPICCRQVGHRWTYAHTTGFLHRLQREMLEGALRHVYADVPALRVARLPAVRLVRPYSLTDRWACGCDGHALDLRAVALGRAAWAADSPTDRADVERRLRADAFEYVWWRRAVAGRCRAKAMGIHCGETVADLASQRADLDMGLPGYLIAGWFAYVRQARQEAEREGAAQ